MFWRPAFTRASSGGGGGGGSGALRSFLYTAAGTALTTGDFTVAIPAPVLADTNFAAVVVGAGLTNQLTFEVVASDNTTASVHVIASAPLTAGDLLFIVIQERTS